MKQPPFTRALPILCSVIVFGVGSIGCSSTSSSRDAGPNDAGPNDAGSGIDARVSGIDASRTPDASGDVDAAIDASSFSDAAPASDAAPSPDAAPADAGGSADAQEIGNCGAGTSFESSVLEVQPGGGSPGAGAEIGSLTCFSGILAITDVTGIWSGEVTSRRPFYLTFAKPPYIPGVSPILFGQGGDTLRNTRFRVYEAGATAIHPDHDASHAELQVLVTPAATGPCTSLDGYTLTVAAHPEAHVVYWSASAPDPALTHTSTIGSVYVGLIVAGSDVSLTMSKPNCQVNFAIDPQTGNVPLLAGSITTISGAAP